MTAAVETMAYHGQTPWHGLGNRVDNLAPAEMLVAAGLDWKVKKRPLSYMAAGKRHVIDDQYALVRDTDSQFLTITGKKYKPIQNEQVLDFFTEFCAAGGMTMETAGSLWEGRYIWALAKVNGGFDVGRGKDHVADYMLISQPHVIGKAAVFKWTGIRVVCWNTLSAALGSNIKGEDVSTFRVPHSIEFNNEVRERAKVALNLAKDQSVQFKEAAQFLAKKRAKQEEVDAFFGEVLHYDATKTLTTATGRDKKPPRMLALFQQALMDGPGAGLSTAEGTWWGALNAVTYVVDHLSGNERDTALRSAWLGPNATMKREALKVAVEYAHTA